MMSSVAMPASNSSSSSNNNNSSSNNKSSSSNPNSDNKSDSLFPANVPQGSSAIKVCDGIFKFVLQDGDRSRPAPQWSKGANALLHYEAYYRPIPEDEKRRLEEEAEAEKKMGKSTNGTGKAATKTQQMLESLMNAKNIQARNSSKGSSSTCSHGHHDHQHDHHHHHHGHDGHQHEHHHHHHGHEDCNHHHHDQEECNHHAHSSSTPSSSSTSDSSSSSSSSDKSSRIPRKKVGDSKQDGKPFELRIGRMFSVKGMEEAVKSMRVGERARFLLSPDMANGYSQLEAVLRKERDRLRNPDAPYQFHSCGASHFANKDENADLMELYGYPLEMEIQLIDVQQPGEFRKQVWEMTGLEKRAAVFADKDAGAVHYRAGKWQEACDCYIRVLGILETLALDPAILDHDRQQKKKIEEKNLRSKKSKSENIKKLATTTDVQANHQNNDASERKCNIHDTKQDMESDDDEQESKNAEISDTLPMLMPEIKTITLQCRLNFAACKLKLEDYAPVIEQCSLVLSEEPVNEKALFRRAQAYLRVGRELDLASNDLQKLLAIQSGTSRDISSSPSISSNHSSQTSSSSSLDIVNNLNTLNSNSNKNSNAVSFWWSDILKHQQESANDAASIHSIHALAPEIRRELQLLDSKMKTVRQKERAMFRGMFS